jgi:hypothetical protein
MPRRIRVLRRLRRLLTIHEPGLWELMAAMVYASPVALFPYTELARDSRDPSTDAYAWLRLGEAESQPEAEPQPDGEKVTLTPEESEAWDQLCREIKGLPL